MVDGIAQPLDHGVLQRTRELTLDLHPRQFAPFGSVKRVALLARCTSHYR